MPSTTQIDASRPETGAAVCASRPLRLLDLFCGAGGCSVGYSRAGFTEITGVDLKPQPNYPFSFVQADALEFLRGVRPGEYDLIHASPPCQGYSRMRHLPWLKDREWPLLIDPTRDALRATGTPYVIENVEDAPLPDSIILCGTMFPGLRVFRHRRFESSHLLMAPIHLRHVEVLGKKPAHRRSHLNDRARANRNGWVSVIRGDVEASRKAMGIDWMTRDELCEAIPPAYTEWIGRQLVEAVAGQP